MYWLTLAWGIIVVFSFFGWGIIFLRLIGDPESRICRDWGYKATLGMAFLTVIGGILNLLYAVSAGMCIAIVIAGAATGAQAICHTARQWKFSWSFIYPANKHRVVDLALFMLLATVAGGNYVSNAWCLHYNYIDDFHTYMVFPHKMLQTGSIGIDPFSYGRMESGLSGQNFLQTLLLSVLGDESFHLLDPGIALILVAAIIVGIGRRRGIPLWCLIPLALSVFYINYIPANTSSLLTSLAITMCVFDQIFRTRFTPSGQIQRCLILAVLLAGACSLKGTNIPAMGLCMGFYFLIAYISERQERTLIIREAMLTASLTTLFLLPSMTLLYLSSGTFLYPYLGWGFSATRYYNDYIIVTRNNFQPAVLLGTLKNEWWPRYAIITFIVAFGIIMKWITRRNIAPITAVLLSVIGTNLLFNWLIRYYLITSYAGLFVMLLWGLAHAFQASKEHFIRRILLGIARSAIAAICLYLTAHNGLMFYKNLPQMIANIKTGVAGRRLDSAEAKQYYHHLLDAVPEGATVLARLDKPYLLDFHNHRVWLLDWPGGASPPPGMPYRRGAQALSDYLLTAGVRYVAYSYRNSANYGNAMRPALAKNYYWIWDHSTALHAFDFQDTLMQLAPRRLCAYKDRDTFILDLTHDI